MAVPLLAIDGLTISFGPPERPVRAVSDLQLDSVGLLTLVVGLEDRFRVALKEEDAAAVRKIADARIPMTSTLAVFIPHFSPDNTPLFRDRLPYPWNTVSSAGQGPVNARLLWEAGVSYGYGTDTSWPPKESLRDELRALSVTFSPKDIVTILTRNAARSVLKADQLGTLEPGKLADIVIVDGDPLADIDDVLKVVTTIKGGVVVSEPAAARRAGAR